MDGVSYGPNQVLAGGEVIGEVALPHPGKGRDPRLRQVPHALGPHELYCGGKDAVADGRTRGLRTLAGAASGRSSHGGLGQLVSDPDHIQNLVA